MTEGVEFLESKMGNPKYNGTCGHLKPGTCVNRGGVTPSYGLL